MTMKNGAIAMCGLLSILAGCGGSGNSSTTYLSQANAAIDLGQRYATADYTDPVTLPTSGSAQYDGFMVVGVEYPGGETNSVVGDMRLTANFADDSVGGRATNFIDAANTNYDGSIVLSNGTIDRVDANFDYQINADLGGSFVDEDAVVYSIAGELSADFYGNNYEVVGGEVVGTSDSIYGLASLNGGIVAER